jgi:transposase
LGCKIHAVCDANGQPTAFVLTGGQASDLVGADELLPKINAKTVIGDKGYDADKRVREVLSEAGKKAVIPPRRNRKDPVKFGEADKELYKQRHKIENFFSRLKDYRGIATRYEKTARNFLSGIYLAAAIMWCN